MRAASAIKLVDFSYEITGAEAPSAELSSASHTFPDRVKSLGDEQGTDEKYLHFSASVEIVDAKKKTLG